LDQLVDALNRLRFTAAIAYAVKEETFFAYNAEAAIFRIVAGRSMTTA